MTDLSQVKALTFDVGGTVFDWRGTIEDELQRLAQQQGADLDVPQFATDWREACSPCLREYDPASSPG